MVLSARGDESFRCGDITAAISDWKNALNSGTRSTYERYSICIALASASRNIADGDEAHWLKLAVACTQADPKIIVANAAIRLKEIASETEKDDFLAEIRGALLRNLVFYNLNQSTEQMTIDEMIDLLKVKQQELNMRSQNR